MEDKKIMTKEDLAIQLAKDCRMQKREALKAVECVFNYIAQGLLDQEVEGVKIAGFGTFTLTERAARTGVNPSNPTEKVEIPASNAIKFKPSKTLKDLINK